MYLSGTSLIIADSGMHLHWYMYTLHRAVRFAGNACSELNMCAHSIDFGAILSEARNNGYFYPIVVVVLAGKPNLVQRVGWISVKPH